ncbi:MAG: YgdI/YgdR family lipoprotein [Verrucomicrobiota bacterium]
MKLSRIILLAGLLAVTGCARHYIITMSNGSQVVTTSKPKQDGNYFNYKDAKGNPARISAGMVREIRPLSDAADSNAQFNPSKK